MNKESKVNMLTFWIKRLAIDTCIGSVTTVISELMGICMFWDSTGVVNNRDRDIGQVGDWHIRGGRGQLRVVVVGRDGIEDRMVLLVWKMHMVLEGGYCA